MPKLPVVSAKEANKVLKRLGFIQVSQKGIHVKFRKLTPTGKVTCIVPLG